MPRERSPSSTKGPGTWDTLDAIELIVPTSRDWTTLGTGGGIETFLSLLFRHASEWNLRITVPCSGPREAVVDSVRFIPIVRAAAKEWIFVRRLRSAARRGTLPFPPHSVILANAEQYAWALRRLKLPIILVSHVAQPEQLRLRHTRLFVRVFQEFIEKPAVTNARRIVVVNPSVKNYYLSRYPGLRPGDATYVPIGLDVNQLEGRPRSNPWGQLSLSPSTNLVLFVGRLYPEKNLGLFIAACDVLRQRGDSFHAVIVGRGIQERTVKDATSTRPWLHWIPQLSKHSDLLDLMSIARVLAVTSRYEGVPLVLQEALGVGTPVVSTDVGRARELISGWLGRIVHDDPSSFADGLHEVLSWNPADVKAASEQARQRIDFRDTMDSLVSVIRSVASEAHG